MALASTLNEMQKESYWDTGNEQSVEITLSGTPSTVTTVTLPSGCKGFRLYPRTNHIRFCVGQTTAAVGTQTSTTVASTDLTRGGIAKADNWEVRLLPPATIVTARNTLYLQSTTASVVVDLEVF